jgi:hypothetical protein
MSYANCLAAALAKAHAARIVTADPEFRAVEPDVPVLWLPLSAGSEGPRPPATPATTGTSGTSAT